MNIMHMGGPEAELSRLRKSLKKTWLAMGIMGLLIAVLFIALIAVAVSQRTFLNNVKRKSGIVENPTVGLVTGKFNNKNVNGLTYAGSLFRGSGFWAPKRILPGLLTDHAAVGYKEDTIFIIGGANAQGNVTNIVWKYDATFHSYSAMAPMPQPRYRFGAALLNDKIYVVGGRSNSNDTNEAMVKSTFIYDIPSNKWTTGKNSLEYHSDTCAAALNGKIYMFGGYGTNYSYLSTSEEYDPSKDQWTEILDMPTPRGDIMCATAAGEIYVLGGYVDNVETPNNTFTTLMESYNPNSKKWTRRPDLLTARGDAAVAILPGDRILLVGGEGHYKNQSDFKYPKHVNEVYYVSDERWVEKAMIPTARFRTAAAQVGGLAYVFGGADLCLDRNVCPALNSTEVFLDVDHPHVYIYLKNEPSYNDDAALTIYPF